VSGRRPPRRIAGAEFVGTVARFAASGIRAAPQTRRYGGEVLRQIGLLCSGSALVIMFVCFLAGQSCGLESAYLARSLSTPALGAAATFGCSVVYVVPFLFGFILAAKVGCGIVAELGAMRVHEEVDALDVMGVSSLVYLVSVRIVASSVALPVIYTLAIGSADLGGWLQSAVRFGDTSQGTYATYRYAFFGSTDVLLSLAQGLTISVAVISVALHYGYSVRGGPVEVGVATAKSMAVNLVAVTFVNLVFVVLFLLKARVPVA
jgi:phospholipid/cholesterol/gamma-HCH transport system permease protein